MTSEVKIRVKLGASEQVQDLSIALTATVLELKQKLARTHSLSVSGLIVLFGGEALQDNKTLQECHIFADTLLIVEFRQTSVRIQLTNHLGEVEVISAEPDWSVQTLKAQVAGRVHAQPEHIRVLNAGDEEPAGSVKLVRDLVEPSLAVVRTLHGGD
jgi:hypothetical protein